MAQSNSSRPPDTTGPLIPPARRRWLLAGAVVANLAACAIYFFSQVSLPLGPSGSDYAQYDDIARSLLDGKGFTLYGQPALARAPGYPVWLAGIYGLTGASLLAARCGQFLLVAATVVFTAGLARQLGHDRAGIVAAYILAINPVVVHYAIRPYSEPLFTALALSSVLAVGPAVRRVVWWRALVGGATAGLACLVRPQMLIVPVFLGLWWLWRLKWRGALAALAYTAAMWFVVSPWTVRNYLVTGRFIPVQTQFGHVLWLSNNERVLSDPVFWGYNVEPVVTKVRAAGPTAPIEEQLRSEREKQGEAFAFLQANVRRIPLLVLYKFVRFLSLGTKVSLGRRAVLWVLDLSLVPLAAVGMVLLWRRDCPELGPTLAVLATTLVSVAIFWGDSRFRFTIEPYLAALAAVAAVALWDRLRGRRELRGNP